MAVHGSHLLTWLHVCDNLRTGPLTQSFQFYSHWFWHTSSLQVKGPCPVLWGVFRSGCLLASACFWATPVCYSRTHYPQDTLPSGLQETPGKLTIALIPWMGPRSRGNPHRKIRLVGTFRAGLSSPGSIYHSLLMVLDFFLQKGACRAHSCSQPLLLSLLLLKIDFPSVSTQRPTRNAH